MNTKITTALAIAIAALATTTGARADTEQDDVRVVMPSGSNEIAAPMPIEATHVAVAEADRAQIGFDISSWNPSTLTLNSHVENSSTFQESGLPAMDLSYISSPVLRGRAGSLLLRASIGLDRVERTGTVEVPGSPQIYDQTAYLIPVELGFEIRPAVLQWRAFSVLMDAGFLPTLMLTERSPFDDGRSLFGLAGRFLVGGSYDVRGLLPVSTPTFFELGVSQTIGSVSEGSMNGTGILAGVRVAI